MRLFLFMFGVCACAPTSRGDDVTLGDQVMRGDSMGQGDRVELGDSVWSPGDTGFVCETRITPPEDSYVLELTLVSADTNTVVGHEKACGDCGGFCTCEALKMTVLHLGSFDCINDPDRLTYNGSYHGWFDSVDAETDDARYHLEMGMNTEAWTPEYSITAYQLGTNDIVWGPVELEER